MKNPKHDIGCRIMKALVILLATLPFAACWHFYFADRIPMPFFNRGNWVVIAIFVVLYINFARIYDAFWISVNSIADLVYSQCLTVLIADAIMFVIIWLMNHYFPNIVPCLIALACQLVLVILWSLIARKWYFSAFPPAKTAVVFSRRSDVPTLFRTYKLENKFDVQLTVTPEACVKNLEQLADFKVVFICDAHSHDRNVILKYCIANGISVYLLPRIGDIILGGASRVHMFHLPVLRVSRRGLSPESALAKRVLDIVCSAIGLLVLSPVMLVTAIAIKATDGGPVFYKQERLTKNGKHFKVIKFRSMRVDAEKDGVARLSSGDKDDRITPVGRIIRKVRIDELPQLFNILGGSMSLVGPRPERPEIAAQYEEVLPEFRLRLQAKAGLTGYAQVYGKYNTTPYDKLQMDLMYIANPSFLEDLRIIMATIKILFMPESTDGVAEGQTTAIEVRSEDRELVGAGKD